MKVGHLVWAVIGLLVGMVLLQGACTALLVAILVKHVPPIPSKTTDVAIVENRLSEPMPVQVKKVVLARLTEPVEIDNTDPLEVEVKNEEAVPVKIVRR